MTNGVLRHDWERNRGTVKSLFIVLFYRTSAWFIQHRNPLIRFSGWPVRILYKVVAEILMGVEIPDRVVAGPGLAVYHGIGIVVNAHARLGKNVSLRQNTTIGAQSVGGPAPQIGDNVSIGANCVILGGIEVGANSIIGAGAILVQSCPEYSIVYGAKAEIRPVSPEKAKDYA